MIIKLINFYKDLKELTTNGVGPFMLIPPHKFTFSLSLVVKHWAHKDKVEVIPIKYICPSNKHPNHSFDAQIDRWPINEIVGFGNYITRNDVSNSLNYPLVNKI